jgi:outer membrane receptor protein involved in Fe transport
MCSSIALTAISGGIVVRCSGTILAAGMFVALSAQSAAAQSPGAALTSGAAENAAPGAEIVVTAQRRKESLQKVPISIAVIGGEALDRSPADGISQALRTIPGVSTQQSYMGGGTQVTVRGVTAGAALFNGSSTVGYYLDSVPYGAIRSAISPDASVYDLERIEVLRGPQGTLYGANAMNGVVRILTNPADLTKFSFKARASVSATQGGDPSYRQDLSVNVPIVADKLAVRATIGYQGEGGWIDTPVKSRANGNDLWNMRLRADAQPTERLSLNFSVWRTRNKFDGPSTGERWNYKSSPFLEPIENNVDTVSGKISYDFDAFSVTSATSSLKYYNGSIINYTPILRSRSTLSTQLNVSVFSEEISINSKASGPWHWSLGAIYREGKDDLFQTVPQISLTVSSINRSKSFAGYGEITRSILDDTFEITGGLRYYSSRIHQDYRNPVTAPAVVAPLTKDDAVTPRAVLTWHPARSATIYASFSQGFRGGFPQSPSASILGAVKPDRLSNYEVGSKGSLFGGRLVYDAALYYIDWKDIQQNVTVSVNGVGFAGTVNGKSASGVGAETSVSLMLAPGLLLNGGVSWNSLTTDADIVSSNVRLFRKGSRLNFSPKYNGNLGLSYASRLSSSLKGTLSVSAQYTSKQGTRALTSGVVNYGESDAAVVPQATFSIASDHGWTASVFGQNLGNFHGVTAPGNGGFVEYYARMRPRTVGLQLEYKY